MTAQELKNSILQRAFTGKLVGHSYSKLEVKFINTDNNPFEIPNHWGWQVFGNICDMYTGNSIPVHVKKQKYEGLKEGYDYIGTKDVGFDQTIDYNNGIRIPFETDFKIAKSGSILMCIEGGSAGRKLGVLDRDVCFGNKLCYFNSQVVLNKYIFYYLQSPLFIKEFSSNMTGIIGGVSIRKLKNIYIPLPPLAEQKRIVEKLEELMPLVERYDESWQRLDDLDKRFPETLKNSLLQEAIKGRLVEQKAEEGTGEDLYKLIQKEKKKLIKIGTLKKQKALPEIKEDEIPFEIPKTWKWVRLGDIAELNPKNQLSDDLKVGFVPMALIEDGYRNKHTYEVKKWGDIKKGYTHFADGDIGIAKITPCFQNRKSVILYNLPNGYGAGTTELSIVRIYSNYLYSKYIFNLFKSHYFISGGVKSFSGTAGQQRINKDYLRLLYIPLPPLAEQKRIVEKLEELMPLCEQLTRKTK